MKSKLSWIPVCLTLLLAQQPLSFDHMLLLEREIVDSASVSAGDLNGDGLPDLILARGRHTPVHDRVLLNDGKGGFEASNLGPTPDRTYSAALADIDRDGDLDVVVSNDAPDAKWIYRNDGRGRFVRSGTFGEATWTTRYVTLADVNGDGAPDIIVANRGGGRGTPSFVCLNDGKGGFGAGRAIESQSATSIAAADLDQDGSLDLFVPHRDGGQSRVLFNDGKGGFAASIAVGPADANARIGVAGDLNGDSLADLVYIDERLRATFVILNEGQRRFGAPVEIEFPKPRPTPYALALHDLNRDGGLDIVVGYNDAPGAIHFTLDGAPRFQTMRWNNGEGHVYGMAFPDLNRDGWPDIVAARSGARNAVWFATPARN